MKAIVRILPGLVATYLAAFQVPPGLASGTPALRDKVHCAQNLKGIGNALALYLNDHDTFPPSLEALAAEEDRDLALIICPAREFMSPARRARDHTGSGSYVYRGADLPLKRHLPDMIVAYCPPGNHFDGVNVLFSSNSVKRPTLKKFQAAIDRDNQLRRQRHLPEKPVDVSGLIKAADRARITARVSDIILAFGFLSILTGSFILVFKGAHFLFGVCLVWLLLFLYSVVIVYPLLGSPLCVASQSIVMVSPLLASLLGGAFWPGRHVGDFPLLFAWIPGVVVSGMAFLARRTWQSLRGRKAKPKDAGQH